MGGRARGVKILDEVIEESPVKKIKASLNKLYTENQIKEMLRLVESGYSMSAVSDLTGISRQAIRYFCIKHNVDYPKRKVKEVVMKKKEEMCIHCGIRKRSSPDPFVRYCEICRSKIKREGWDVGDPGFYVS